MATYFGDSSSNLFRGTTGADDITGAGGDDLALGKAGNDHITGDAGDDLLIGDEGADMLLGGAGADMMFGGVYNEASESFTDDNDLDQLFGDAGNDLMLIGNKDVIIAGAGDDIVEIVPMTSALTTMTIDGGTGVDIVNLAPYKLKTTVYLDQGVAGSDIHMINVEGVVLGDGGSQVFGGAFADLVRGGAGVDVMSGGGGNDQLSGLAGDDRFTGGAGNDQIDGGDGYDVAIYTGLSRSYKLSLSKGSATVSSAAEGADSLTSIERIQFVDGYFATGTADNAAKVYRIYQAALGRDPDANGLGNWVRAMEKGTSLQSIGDGFLNSPEFVGRFGTGSNADFVNLLYKNVLHRAPDAKGLNDWVHFIESGHSRTEALTGFSESAEFINGTAATVQRGLWISDADAAKVARLYDTVLDRMPDAQGAANWTGALQRGESLQTVANGIVDSPEFKVKYGTLDNSHFVQQLYQNVLGRPADDSGLISWTNFLNSGHSRGRGGGRLLRERRARPAHRALYRPGNLGRLRAAGSVRSLSGPHAIVLRVVLDLGEAERLHHRRHIVGEAAA